MQRRIAALEPAHIDMAAMNRVREEKKVHVVRPTFSKFQEGKSQTPVLHLLSPIFGRVVTMTWPRYEEVSPHVLNWSMRYPHFPALIVMLRQASVSQFRLNL